MCLIWKNLYLPHIFRSGEDKHIKLRVLIDTNTSACRPIIHYPERNVMCHVTLNFAKHVIISRQWCKIET